MTRKTPPSGTKSGEKAGNTLALSQWVGKVLEPTVARKAGMTLDLIKAWPELAGAEFARTTCPVKMEWPRRASEDDPFKPATLVVASDSTSALFLQHRQMEILEQVNLYFGFEAVGRIRIVQRPVGESERDREHQRRELTASEEERLSQLVQGIEDPELRSTVLKLGKGLILANTAFISD